MTASDAGLAIETHGLSKTLGSHTAVRNLSLGVRRGEIFGFLGPNGAGVLPEHPLRGYVLITFECVLARCVTFYLGTRFSTLTAGVFALGLQGVAFMGGWLEQVSGFSQSQHIVTLGVATSLIMPSESVWRRAAFEMQTPLAGSLSFSPFANASIPSAVALAYALAFAVCVFSAALYRFNQRDLQRQVSVTRGAVNAARTPDLPRPTPAPACSIRA